MRCVWWGVVLLCVGVVGPGFSVAFAQDSQTAGGADDQRAREHFQAGSRSFDAGDYELAAHEFETAYELSGRPALLFNLYIAYERLGDLSHAADYLHRFLTEGEPGERRGALESRLARIRERLEGQREEAAAREEAEQGRLREAAQSPSAGPGALPWIVAGSGGVLVLGGTVMLLMAQSDVNAVENPDGDRPMWRDVEGAYDRAPGLSTIGGIVLGVGGAAALVGLSWGVFAGGGSDDVQVDVSVGPGRVRLAGTF